MAHGTLSGFKPCGAMQRSCAHTVRVSLSSSLLSRPNPSSNRNCLQTNVAHSRRQCGSGAHEPSSSRRCLSSASSLRSRRSAVLPSRASSRFVVRSAKESKGKDSKGKNKGGKGGGPGSKGEAPKRTGPRPNVWSKDIAETEYQGSRSESKPPSANQQGREATASRDGKRKGGRGGSAPGGNGSVPQGAASRLQTDFDDDYTGVVATGGIPVETEEILQAPV